MDVSIKKLYGRKREHDIADALDNICSYENFMNFKFAPMDMGEACEAFISNFEEKIEQFLRKRKTNDF